MFVADCWLFVVCGVLFADRWSLFVVYGLLSLLLLFSIMLLRVARCVLCVAFYSLCAACSSLRVNVLFAA